MVISEPGPTLWSSTTLLRWAAWCGVTSPKPLHQALDIKHTRSFNPRIGVMNILCLPDPQLFLVKETRDN
ncbi:hypothetical protein I79_003125 [Cricetulus griseus]|uniref:Uncharacterized protein n=1 Tax=Cricetulus griseus TaxID=10029 RepID=G3GZ91_CRIGR|nr:hypothetical protein I79_003125 [Cricetulus griseus]